MARPDPPARAGLGRWILARLAGRDTGTGTGGIPIGRRRSSPTGATRRTDECEARTVDRASAAAVSNAIGPRPVTSSGGFSNQASASSSALAGRDHQSPDCRLRVKASPAGPRIRPGRRSRGRAGGPATGVGHGYRHLHRPGRRSKPGSSRRPAREVGQPPRDESARSAGTTTPTTPCDHRRRAGRRGARPHRSRSRPSADPSIPPGRSCAQIRQRGTGKHAAEPEGSRPGGAPRWRARATPSQG